MILPDKFRLTESLHGHGANGMYVYEYRDDAIGVQVDIRRENRSAPETRTWTSDHLPDREFGSEADLRAALADVEPLPPFAWVVDRIDSERDSPNKCWRCREGFAVHGLHCKSGWRKHDYDMVFVCDLCLEAAKADPRAVQKARRDYVAARKAPTP